MLHSAFRRDRYTRTFTYLALVFTVFFYVFPLSYAVADGGVPLGSRYFRFGTAEIQFASLALLVFSVGFALAGQILKGCSGAPAPSAEKGGIEQRPAVEALVAAIMIGVAIYAFYVGLYRQTYAVRREEAEASYVLSTFLVAVYSVGCFYILNALNQDQPRKTVFWTTLCVLVSINFVGRTSLLLLFSLPFVHYVRRPERALVLIIIAATLFLPAIAQGKEIIYAIMTGGGLSSVLLEVYAREFDFRGIVGNLSHIVVSLVYAPDLVDRLGGFRYFWDIPHGVIFYLRLIGIDAGYSLTYYNTEIIMRVRESIVPIGYLGFGYVQAGMIGVLLAGMLYRYVGYLLGRVCAALSGKSFATIFFFAFLAANSFYIGEPRALVLTLAFPIVVILSIHFVGRRRVHAPRGAAT